MKKIYLLMSFAVALTAFTACGADDDFTESIFDINIPVFDDAAATAPFDKWIYENFTVPYNVEIEYRFNFPASDLNFQLAPAEYKRSQMLTYFIKYLFYEVYTKYGGEDFMKRYGPRIFHYIGSSGYSPTTGTEVLGTASGGVKITLYKLNELKPYTDDITFSVRDIDDLNEDYFHTMHHEFSHILHQTKSYPITFGQVTSGTYDPINWQDRDSTLCHQMGYVTHYASSANYEDFVETLSCIITDTEHRWMTRIIDACLNGVRAGDKEQVMALIEKLELNHLDQKEAVWNKFDVYTELEYNTITGVYEPSDRLVFGLHRDLTTQVVNSTSTAYVKKYKYEKFQAFNSFREFMDWVPVKTDDDLAGMSSILTKIDIANKWYNEKWGLDIFTIRQEVVRRQNDLNRFLKEDIVIYDYK